MDRNVYDFISYFQNQKRKSPKTLEAYSNDLNEFFTFLKEEFEIDDPKDIGHNIIRSWIVYLLEEKKISNNSINRKISCLRTFFKYLQKREIIKNNPATKQPFLKIDKKISIPLSQKEITNLLDDLEYEENFDGIRDKFMIEILYNTGIRRTELINLKKNYFDIYQKKIKVIGKGDKERYIPITDSLIRVFNRYMTERNNLGIDSEFLLTTKNNTEISESFVYKKINSYLDLVTSKKKKSPHILRHSFASHILEEGIDITCIKDILGHSDLSSTQVYVKNSLRRIKDQFIKCHPRNKKNKVL